MLSKYNVNVKLNSTFDPNMAANYEYVALATGIIPRTPKIDGINHSKVVSYIDVLKGKVKIANSIAIIGAGGIGFDVAEYLSHSGTSSSKETSLFMKEWGVDTSFIARGGVEGVKADIPKNNRKIFLLQRRSVKVGANLGKTTGWIQRFSLRNKEVKMINGVSYELIDDSGLHILKNNQKKVGV